MKIVWIYTVLLSIAALTLTLADVVPAEKFQKILKRANNYRAGNAELFKIANMHVLVYDDKLAEKALNNLKCEVQSNFLLVPDEQTHKDFDNSTFDDWIYMKRYRQFLQDPRQYKIGCADIKDCKQMDVIDTKSGGKEEHTQYFIYNCAIQFSIAGPNDTGIKKGPPGSQCEIGKNERNLCVMSKTTNSSSASTSSNSSETSGSSGSSGSGATESSAPSGSSSSKLAPFIVIALLIVMSF